jgi:hypothetical protein
MVIAQAAGSPFKKAFSQQSCHQGPFDNRRDFGTNRFRRTRSARGLAEIAFEVYCPRISYEHYSSDFLFPQTQLVLSITRFRVYRQEFLNHKTSI